MEIMSVVNRKKESSEDLLRYWKLLSRHFTDSLVNKILKYKILI